MKTVEELLKPRWKVIADFPFNTYYKVGGVITDDRLMAARNENGHAVFACEWNDYPNILRKLEWWEKREPEDMPDYVKSTLNNDHTYKVKFFKEDHCITISPSSRKLSLKFTIPATEQEYIDYIEKQKRL